MELAALDMKDLPHYTYEDYAQWEGQWEIIGGIPYSMVPAPVLKHQEICLEIASQLKELLKTCKDSNCKVYMAIDWQITDDTVVQPDVLVVCGENPDDKKLLISPVLVFEVLSPSTARKDRALKYRLYQDAGVKYYCIISPDNDSIEVYLLTGSQYEKENDMEDGKIVFQPGDCRIALDLKKIFTR